jgi:hypothetical protein
LIYVIIIAQARKTERKKVLGGRPKGDEGEKKKGMPKHPEDNHAEI